MNKIFRVKTITSVMTTYIVKAADAEEAKTLINTDRSVEEDIKLKKELILTADELLTGIC